MSVHRRLDDIRQSLGREIRTYRLIMEDPRCPRRAKVLLGLALAYLAMPFDLIPDFIPIVGHLDDAIIVPGLVWMALRAIPAVVVEDCRRLAAGSSPRNDECPAPSKGTGQDRS